MAKKRPARKRKAARPAPKRKVARAPARAPRRPVGGPARPRGRAGRPIPPGARPAPGRKGAGAPPAPRPRRPRGRVAAPPAPPAPGRARRFFRAIGTVVAHPITTNRRIRLRWHDWRAHRAEMGLAGIDERVALEKRRHTAALTGIGRTVAKTEEELAKKQKIVLEKRKVAHEERGRLLRRRLRLP